jgi:protein-S-isoprenylcysteine O-methyltransferase Ste14
VGLILSVVWLVINGLAFATGTLTAAIQIAAVVLMIWARVTFGMRSFHATANPTEGGLVTTGPYRYFRHPIYAAILYFLLGSLIAHPRLSTLFGTAIAAVMIALRIWSEETLLRGFYPEYAAYAHRTARIVPFVL